MKKVIFILSAICFVFGLFIANSEHNHVDAASKSIVWQCEVCGDRAYCQSETTGPPTGGCGGDYFKRHIWHRM